MISFKNYLTEAIVEGSITDRYTYAVVASNKFLMLFNTKERTGKGVYVSSYLKYDPSIIKDLAKLIASLPYKDERGHHWSDSELREKALMPFFTANIDKTRALAKQSGSDEEIKISTQLQAHIRTAIKKNLNDILKHGGTITNINYGQQFKNINYKDVNAVEEALKQTKLELYASMYAPGTLEIDNTNQTINIMDFAQQWQSRIGKVDSKGNTAYIIPFADHSINQAALGGILSDLYKNFPKLAVYKIKDPYVTDGETLALKDIVMGLGRLGKDIKNMESRVKGQVFTAYHGTSLDTFNRIKTNGMRPGMGIEYSDKIKGHSENMVYLSHEIADARKYAVRASGAGPAVVLQITIDDPTKITFDEDQLNQGIARIPARVANGIKVRLKQLWPNDNSLQYIDGRPLVDNPLNPWAIRDLFNKVQTQEQANILKLIGSYAVGAKSSTFAYKGIIPASKIKVIENFKSTSHSEKEGDDGFNSRYNKIVSSFKDKNALAKLNK